MNIKYSSFSQLKLFHLEIYACEINITILASFLLAYLGYIFFLKLYFSYLGTFCFSYVSYEKAYDWIFKKCSFFSCLLTKKLNTFILLDPILIFMLPIHYSFLWIFLFHMKLKRKSKMFPEKKEMLLTKKKKKNRSRISEKKISSVNIRCWKTTEQCL